MTIYEKIKFLREKAGMSQQELAEKVGFKTASAVNKIELGLRDINQSRVKAFAAALDTSPAYLLGCDVPIQNSSLDLTPHEKDLVTAYRKQPEMQAAVDKLLGISKQDIEYIPGALR